MTIPRLYVIVWPDPNGRMHLHMGVHLNLEGAFKDMRAAGWDEKTKIEGGRLSWSYVLAAILPGHFEGVGKIVWK